jgi:hypothetical protein
MKNRIFIIFLMLSYCSITYSQTDSIVNPNKKWFFGAEIGTNKILSFYYNEPTKSFQGGFITEYYYSKKWSITGRLKYFKIGASRGIVYNTYNNTVDLKNYHRFDGEVIAVPINLKFEYKIFRNFRGNFKFGFALNQETKSEYQYPIGERTNYSTFFIDYNLGLGFIYYVNNNSAIYIESEFKGLGKDRDDLQTFIAPNSTNNSFFNFGVKHCFKKH